MNGDKVDTTHSTGIRLYIIAVLFTTFSFFLQVIPIDTANYFQSKWAISSATFINLASAFFITYSVMQIPGGILFDRVGIKYVLPVSIFTTVIGIILYWFSPHSSFIAASRLLCGIGCSVAYISSIFVAATYFPPSRLPLLIGLVEAVGTAGTLIATEPLELSINYLGWNTTGIIIISFGVLLGCLSIIAVKNTAGSNSTKPVLNILKDILFLLKNRLVIYILFYSFSTWLVLMSFAGYWLKDYMMVMHQFDKKTALTLVELYWTSFLIFSITLGYFTKNDFIAKVNLMVLSGIGFVAYLFMCIPILFNYTLIAIVAIAGGISSSGVIMAFSVITKSVSPNHRGTAIALNNTFIVL